MRTRQGMANVQAVKNPGEAMHLILEYLDEDGITPIMQVKMKDEAQCQELIATLVKCRDFIWRGKR